MDVESIMAVGDELGIGYEAAERWLKSETGCYADIDGERIWMSGQLIARCIEASNTVYREQSS